MKKTKGHLFLALVLEGLVGLHRTIHLQLLQHYWLGHRLGLLSYWMVCLGNKQIILLFFRLHPSTAFCTLLLTMMATPFQKMGIPDHLTWLLRNLYAGQEATVRTGHGTTDWFQIRRGVGQGCILSPCLFNLYAETSCEMPGWLKHKLELRLPGEISVTSDTQMIPPYGRKWRGTEEPFDEGERGDCKSWL